MDGYRTCWMCGRNGCSDPLDRHHIFCGPFRKKSEKYGLVVDLCHGSCHCNGPMAVHQNARTMRKLKQWGQRKAMAENGWTIEDFIREFGKNYLDDDEPETPLAEEGVFEITDEEVLY